MAEVNMDVITKDADEVNDLTTEERNFRMPTVIKPIITVLQSCSLFVIRYSLFIIYYSLLFIIYYLLFIIHHHHHHFQSSSIIIIISISTYFPTVNKAYALKSLKVIA